MAKSLRFANNGRIWWFIDWSLKEDTALVNVYHLRFVYRVFIGSEYTTNSKGRAAMSHKNVLVWDIDQMGHKETALRELGVIQ